MYVRRGGNGDPVLLLLHGLGGTGEVWQGLLDQLASWWPGSWIVPDLPGHGRSAPPARYSFGGVAADVSELVPAGREVVVLGHSLGGALALTLASGWFGVPVTAVCGLGIKVRWSPEDVAKSRELAAWPARTFATHDEAAERWLKVAGLQGLWTVDSPAVEPGVVEKGDGWQVALDQGALGFAAPDIAGMLAAARAQVVLAAGEHDPMSPAEHLRELCPNPVILPGLGHNAHAEDPAALRPLLNHLLSPST
ncbi:MAG TPA: alpha/beta hydrolase [Amycolatopsis sp.]|uniref:alpha/beta fold hydrolase n=1 Tax=Amycolatopsis sp. TaxID=37632 RepID=UPI002B49BDF1|nr:alpha/beta hydrolase [Amycolatopsis sp.]HKS43561.1 alpha/beta hydrolase [Amycolatopsis sp.]